MRSIDVPDAHSQADGPKPADVPEDVLDHFAGPARPMSPADVDAVMRRFTKALVERMRGGELTHHRGHRIKPADRTNQRNATGGRTVLTDEGPLDLDIRRHRDGTFEPQLIPKHARRFTARESVHAQLRKVVQTRSHVPNDEAATKLIWLALRHITATWQRRAHHWQAAMNQFAILYEGRFTKPAV